MNRRAALIVIGNEILSGKIVDQNTSVLAKTLRKLGVTLVRATTIADDATTITEEVRSASQHYDWVFTSGGVGPTHDDVTVSAVARAFSVPVVVHPELDALIRRTYREALKDGHLAMARVPEGTELISNEAVPWPAMKLRNVWMLPGVPQVFRVKMTLVSQVIGAGAPYVSLGLITRLDEGHLKPMLDETVGAFPEVEIGSYPQWDEPIERTRITFDGRDRSLVERARGDLQARLDAPDIVRLED